MVENPEFTSLDELNDKAQQWIELDYNSQHHSGIQMKPLERFTLDHTRLTFLQDDEFMAEVFFYQDSRKVSKTNVFSINSQKYECPVDLREKTIQVRFDRSKKDIFIVYYRDKRMGQASLLDVLTNSKRRRIIKGEAL